MRIEKGDRIDRTEAIRFQGGGRRRMTTFPTQSHSYLRVSELRRRNHRLSKIFSVLLIKFAKNRGLFFWVCKSNNNGRTKVGGNPATPSAGPCHAWALATPEGPRRGADRRGTGSAPRPSRRSPAHNRRVGIGPYAGLGKGSRGGGGFLP